MMELESHPAGEKANIGNERRWKFNDLKTYASTEWLVGHNKKYRQVFDCNETSYVYAELSFHNKKFDVEDWEINVELRCYSVQTPLKEICVIPFHRKVYMSDAISYIREGWGNNQPGTFWEKGEYYWEAWIEHEMVASRVFYIEEADRPITSTDNPYCQIEGFGLFEGPHDLETDFQRIYLRRFNAEETRYVYADVTLRNCLPAQQWNCEIFIKFFNSARELKGQLVILHQVEKGDDFIRFDTGWGSNVRGSWRKGCYSVEIVFMDQVLGIMHFEVGDNREEGTNELWLPIKCP